MPHLTRRTAVAGGLSVAGLATWGAVSSDTASATILREQLLRKPTLRRSDYEGSVGKVFVAEADGTAHRVRLVAIHDHGENPRETCFTLVFEPRAGTALPETIYTLSRAGIRPHALLLNSIGNQGRLQAVVNGAH